MVAWREKITAPDKKKMDLLETGTKRTHVRGELIQSTWTSVMVVHITTDHTHTSLPPAFLPTTKQTCLRVRQRLWDILLPLAVSLQCRGDRLAGVARGQTAS